MLLEDGKGRGYTMSVSSSNRGNVSAKTNPRSYYISRQEGLYFSWYSSFNADSGDYVIYVKNTSQEKKLVISRIMFGGDEAGKYSVESVTGIPAGTAIEGAFFNRSMKQEADADSFGDAKILGLTTEKMLGAIRVLAGATGSGSANQSLILGNTDALAIKYEGVTGIVDVTVFGYYESHSDITN